MVREVKGFVSCWSTVTKPFVGAELYGLKNGVLHPVDGYIGINFWHIYVWMLS